MQQIDTIMKKLPEITKESRKKEDLILLNQANPLQPQPAEQINQTTQINQTAQINQTSLNEELRSNQSNSLKRSARAADLPRDDAQRINLKVEHTAQQGQQMQAEQQVATPGEQPIQ